MPTAPQESSITFRSPFGFSADKALNTPLGLASPLWLAFAGAASAGVAYWWMTRWMRPANLEAAMEISLAKLAPKVEAPVLVAPEPEVLAEPAPLTAATVEPEPLVPEPLVEPTPAPDVITAPEVKAEPAPAVSEAPLAKTSAATPLVAKSAANKPSAAKAKPGAKANVATAAKIVAPVKTAGAVAALTPSRTPVKVKARKTPSKVTKKT